MNNFSFELESLLIRPVWLQQLFIFGIGCVMSLLLGYWVINPVTTEIETASQQLINETEKSQQYARLIEQYPPMALLNEQWQQLQEQQLIWLTAKQIEVILTRHIEHSSLTLLSFQQYFEPKRTYWQISLQGRYSDWLGFLEAEMDQNTPWVIETLTIQKSGEQLQFLLRVYYDKTGGVAT